ncbi:hypothetical protein MSAN_01079300 [Mycena sanguinolenta]|uniref:Uncharacterized protein n=1 Tax=Mycena sanguinolenta TaxID=230812 RepID=A0A8H6YN60_9AGAR|nr:hypothetical protein MSAN_01079300 [Mycena sanguinolenta]
MHLHDHYITSSLDIHSAISSVAVFCPIEQSVHSIPFGRSGYRPLSPHILSIESIGLTLDTNSVERFNMGLMSTRRIPGGWRAPQRALYDLGVQLVAIQRHGTDATRPSAGTAFKLTRPAVGIMRHVLRILGAAEGVVDRSYCT